MAVTIKSDNFPTLNAGGERKTDALTAAKRDETSSRAPAPSDRADVGRAQQALSQQFAQRVGTPIESSEQARERLSDLKRAIAADPASAARAMGLVNQNIFEAASARPTA